MHAGEIFDIKHFPDSVQKVNDVHFTKECNNGCVFLSKYVPTLFQLIINVGLIPAVIDLLTPLEGHYLRNRLYRSCLLKNTVSIYLQISLPITTALLRSCASARVQKTY